MSLTTVVDLRRWRAALALTVVVAVPVACARPPQPEPGGASVIVATPHMSATPESEPPAPQTPSSADSPPPSQLPQSLPSASPALEPPMSPGPGINDCIGANAANLGLAAAQDPAAARAAADQLERYNPPPNVRDAIEYFAATQGAMFTDPNFATRNKVISDWVKQLCPS